MSGDGKRGAGHWPQATAPILDPTSTSPNRAPAVAAACWGITDIGALLWGEWVLPPARLAPLGECAGEIIKNLLAIFALHVRHVVALDHPLEALVPALARHALRGVDLEAVTRGAEIERFVSVGAGGILLGVFRGRPHRLRLTGSIERGDHDRYENYKRSERGRAHLCQPQRAQGWEHQ